VKLLKSIEDSFIAESLFDLAVSYDLGVGVRTNDKRAFSLYMKAALLGHAESCQQISEYYREGKLVARDMSVAKAWKMRAACAEEDISPSYRVKLRPDHGTGNAGTHT
jgi:TPR repeat protein